MHTVFVPDLFLEEALDTVIMHNGIEEDDRVNREHSDSLMHEYSFAHMGLSTIGHDRGEHQAILRQ